MTSNAAMEFSRDGQTLHCTGEWTISGIKKLPWQAPRITHPKITVETSGISLLDTAGAFKLYQIIILLRKAGKEVNVEGFNPQHQMIFSLVESKINQLPADTQIKPQSIPWLTLL